MTAGKTVTFTDSDYLINEFIDIASAPDNEYLRGDGTWQPTSSIVGNATLTDLLDTTITSLANNHFLTYDNANSVWKNVSDVNTKIALGLVIGTDVQA